VAPVKVNGLLETAPEAEPDEEEAAARALVLVDDVL
jgi:hypothetical protein